MTARTWFRKLFAHPAVPSVRRRRPRVETLEDRLVPASYHVTSLLDDGSPGTLRDAILQANANPGPDTIDFQVSGTITIDESSPLPAFTDAATTTVCGEITLDARDSGTVAAGRRRGVRRLLRPQPRQQRQGQPGRHPLQRRHAVADGLHGFRRQELLRRRYRQRRHADAHRLYLLRQRRSPKRRRPLQQRHGDPDGLRLFRQLRRRHLRQRRRDL